MDGLGWDGISPDRSISRSPSNDNKIMEMVNVIEYEELKIVMMTHV